MPTAWLVIAAGERRQHAGNEGYDDDPSSHYSWDDTVANADKVRVGDFIVLWDKTTLLGASVIGAIAESGTHKKRKRCPKCGKTGIKTRKTKLPRYRCYKSGCLAEFDEPSVETIAVHTRRSDHAAGWIELAGLLGAADLRQLCVHPGSIQSIRELDWEAFRRALPGQGSDTFLQLIERAGKSICGGHGLAIVRARKGQGLFRQELLRDFGAVCAFTGPQPNTVLEAAHLYSYAEVGVHHEFGGLLLRRDLHRLFDLGLLAVHPETRAIDIHEDLEGYPLYANLQGKEVCVNIDPRANRWLRLHWAQYRS